MAKELWLTLAISAVVTFGATAGFSAAAVHHATTDGSARSVTSYPPGSAHLARLAGLWIEDGLKVRSASARLCGGLERGSYGTLCQLFFWGRFHVEHENGET
jgi:hypothetical protein